MPRHICKSISQGPALGWTSIVIVLRPLLCMALEKLLCKPSIQQMPLSHIADLALVKAAEARADKGRVMCRSAFRSCSYVGIEGEG